MANEAFALVSEYLASEDDRIRSNAVTALATLGNEESVEKLVEVALDDASENVRQRAQGELEELPEASVEHAVGALRTQLHNTANRRSAYVQLGRLRSGGLSISPQDMSFGKRLATVWETLMPLTDSNRRWRIRWQPLIRGFVGGGLGAALVALYLYVFAGLYAWIPPSLFLVSVVFAAVITFVSGQFANPFPLHFDRLAGALVECAWAAVAAGVCVSCLILIPLLTGELNVWMLIYFVIAMGLAGAAVRAGTLLALVELQHRWMQQTLAVLVGFALGMLVMSLALPVSMDSEYSKNYAGLWLLALPVMFGMSYAFVRLDRQTSYRGSVTGPLGYPISLGIATIFFGIVVLAAIPGIAPEESTLANKSFSLESGTAESNNGSYTLLGLNVPVQEIKFEIQSPAAYFEAWLSVKQKSNQISALELRQFLGRDTTVPVAQGGYGEPPHVATLLSTGSVVHGIAHNGFGRSV